MLGQDKKTKIIVKIEGTDKLLIDSYCNGKYNYNKKDVKLVLTGFLLKYMWNKQNSKF